MFLINDIIYNITSFLDFKSLINFHLINKETKLLFEEKILNLKPCYLNGLRYLILEKLKEEYDNIPYNNKRPEEFQPYGTASWHRIDNSVLLNLPITISLSNYNYLKNYELCNKLNFKKSDEILDKWFDLIREGDVIKDDKYSLSNPTFFTIMEKSKYTKTQISINIGINRIGIRSIRSNTSLCKIMIPPRTDIYIE
jgi:hypothetical protein